MENGAITGYVDVAQVVLYVFWAFFFGLVVWLRIEDHREGYPLEADPSGAVDMRGSFLIPKPKIFKLRDGTTRSVPRFDRDERPLAARRVAKWPGAPLTPTGNPLVDGVGPAAWAERADRPDWTWDNRPRLAPARLEPHYFVPEGDPDPRGMPVVGADGRVAGTVVDIWIDRAEHVVRYLEISVGEARGPLLMPMGLAKVEADRVRAKSLLAVQFADAPGLKSPDEVTLLEEDRASAYFSGGHLYATRQRTEPIL